MYYLSQYFKENSYIINAKKPLLSFLNNESQKATNVWENNFLLAKIKISEIIHGTQMEKNNSIPLTVNTLRICI